MIGQGFNYVDSIIKEMNDFFETRAENLGPKEDKKKPPAAAKKIKEIPKEKEKGRLRLQCRRVQQRIDRSSASKQEVLHPTR